MPGVPNPDWEDGDGDGVPDQCGNCPCTANPNQDDSDGDGNGNWCDPDPMNPDGSGPDGDEDGDGIDNDSDPCGCDPTNTCDQCPMQLVELPIYGLGRVGVAKPEGVVISDPSNQGPVYERPIGEKFYELSDHLGNVRMVIGDIKRSVLDNNDVPGEFFADVHSFMNAYPYGMPHPGRWWDSSLVLNTTTTYRYGYNGVETDPEIEGQPHAHFSTHFRQYDPRVARWWSNDPIVHPWESPYAAMAANPIAKGDKLGLESDPLSDDSGGFWSDVADLASDILTGAGQILENTVTGIGSLFNDARVIAYDPRDQSRLSVSFDHYMNHGCNPDQPCLLHDEPTPPRPVTELFEAHNSQTREAFHYYLRMEKARGMFKSWV